MKLEDEEYIPGKRKASTFVLDWGIKNVPLK